MSIRGICIGVTDASVRRVHTRAMRLLIAVMLLAAPLHAQLRETVEVNVLELDVAVVDRAGKPVDGLTQADFDVQIGGKPKAVTNFYAVKRGAILDVPGEPPARAETAAPETTIPTTVVLFVDDMHLGIRSKLRAIEALKEYVRANVGASTSAMIARWNGSLDVRTRLTDRPGPLLAELDRMAKEPGLLTESDRRLMLREISETFNGLRDSGRSSRVEATFHQMVNYADQEAHMVDKTIEGLGEMIRVASAFEGRKSLLYVSEGLPLSAAAEVFDYWDRASRAIGTEAVPNLQRSGQEIFKTVNPARYDRSRQYERVIRTAQASNVAFYGFDAGGARGFVGRGVEEAGGGVAQLDSMLARSNTHDGVRRVANETGGRFIIDENDPGKALSVLSEQFATYYSLGVRAPSSTRLMKVSVKVKSRAGLRVMTSRHRRPLSRQEKLERSVRSHLYTPLYTPRAENPLGAEVSLGTATPVGSECVVPMRLSVARERADLYFALLDERQQESDVRSTTIAAAHSMSLGVKAGRYVLSLALADPASGETSYLQGEIDARGCR